MLVYRHLHKIIILCICLWFTSCSTAYYLDNFPDYANDVFYHKVIKAENNLDGINETLYLNAAKLRTQYTFAFIIEEADRLIENDYDSGKKMYLKALKSFELAIINGEKAIQLRYPELRNKMDWATEDISFTKDDVPYLFWLGAAYGGAISSSRGKAKWVIQLPLVGYLLEEALEVYPSWNYGAIHSALISYTMARTDLMDNKIENAKLHYKQAMLFSSNQDAGAKVSFAENVLVSIQEKDKFKILLNEVIIMDLEKNKELSLGNLIARERAIWLLSKTDELFY